MQIPQRMSEQIPWNIPNIPQAQVQIDPTGMTKVILKSQEQFHTWGILHSSFFSASAFSFSSRSLFSFSSIFLLWYILTPAKAKQRINVLAAKMYISSGKFSRAWNAKNVTSATLGQLKNEFIGMLCSFHSNSNTPLSPWFAFLWEIKPGRATKPKKIPFPLVLDSFSSNIWTIWSWKRGRIEYFKEIVEVEMLLKDPHKWWIPGDQLSDGIPKNPPGNFNS